MGSPLFGFGFCAGHELDVTSTPILCPGSGLALGLGLELGLGSGLGVSVSWAEDVACAPHIDLDLVDLT